MAVREDDGFRFAQPILRAERTLAIPSPSSRTSEPSERRSGIHNRQCPWYAKLRSPTFLQQTLVVMVPGFRRDDVESAAIFLFRHAIFDCNIFIDSQEPDRASSAGDFLRESNCRQLIAGYAMRVLKFSAFIFSVAASLCLSVSAQADCVAKGTSGQKEIVGYDAGVDLVSATNYIPAGTTSEFGLNMPYDAKIPYSGRIESDFDNTGVGKSFLPIERRSLGISRIADDHPLVKNGRIDKGDTLVTIDIPSEISG